MDIITINDPIVSYKVNSKKEHEFTVSLVNLLDNHIRHSVDDDGNLFYYLYNKQTENKVKVVLTESDTTERVYVCKDTQRVIKLRVI